MALSGIGINPTKDPDPGDGGHLLYTRKPPRNPTKFRVWCIDKMNTAVLLIFFLCAIYGRDSAVSSLEISPEQILELERKAEVYYEYNKAERNQDVGPHDVSLRSWRATYRYRY